MRRTPELGWSISLTAGPSIDRRGNVVQLEDGVVGDGSGKDARARKRSRRGAHRVPMTPTDDDDELVDGGVKTERGRCHSLRMRCGLHQLDGW